MKIVSVITTCYNAEKYIRYALKSVLTQNIYLDIEVEYIIVNDCSTDNSLTIIKNCIRKYTNDKIKCALYNLTENIGCGAARKYGINKASGDYFMFLDADDYYINKDFICKAVKDIEKYNADIVEYNVKRENIDLLNHKTYEFDKNEAKLKALFHDNLIKFNVWTKIYKRKVIESYPYSTKRTYEDIRTIPIWLINANKVVVKPSVEINYRKVETSIIRNNEIETRIGTISAIASLFERFKDNKNILKYMYIRSLTDLNIVLNGRSSMDKGFNELSKLNTYMLSYLYPNKYKEMTFNIEDLKQDKIN